jgi:hypothetical protein
MDSPAWGDPAASVAEASMAEVEVDSTAAVAEADSMAAAEAGDRV